MDANRGSTGNAVVGVLVFCFFVFVLKKSRISNSKPHILYMCVCVSNAIQAVVPQLEARLQHSSSIVQAHIRSILCRLCASHPRDMAYPVLLGADVKPKAYAPILEALGETDPSLLNAIAIFKTELLV